MAECTVLLSRTLQSFQPLKFGFHSCHDPDIAGQSHWWPSWCNCQGHLAAFISLDLSKAFDPVDHSLFEKLLPMASVKPHLPWFFSYFLSILRTFFPCSRLNVNVSQASVPSCLLFSLYTQIPGHVIHCNNFYADVIYIHIISKYEISSPLSIV